MHRPLQLGQSYSVTETVVGCQDKKSGAMVVIESRIESQNDGKLDARVLSGMFIRGLGTWPEDTSIDATQIPIKVCPELKRKLPNAEPTLSIVMQTS